MAKENVVYTVVPLIPAGGMLQVPLWMPETMVTTEPYIHFAFSYTYTIWHLNKYYQKQRSPKPTEKWLLLIYSQRASRH